MQGQSADFLQPLSSCEWWAIQMVPLTQPVALNQGMNIDILYLFCNLVPSEKILFLFVCSVVL